MTAVLVYVTAGSADEAATIGRALVEGRLVACANVVDGVRSIYRWQDAIQDDTEALLIAKTREALVADVVARVKELHSYDCPCVVALPIVDGNRDFLNWIGSETTPPEPPPEP